MKKIILLSIIGLVAAAVVIWILISGVKTHEPEKVSLMLDWAPNTNHTGIYAAYEKGWFAEAGIDLEIVTPAGVSVEAVVGSGKAQFGISFQEYVTSARIEGVPIVSIAAVMQHNTSGFAFLKNHGIKSAADFAGKRYGGWGLPIEESIISAVVARDGGDPAAVEYVNIGTGDLLVMLGRDIDFAWIFYGWQGIEAGLRGLDMGYVMMSDYLDVVPDYYTPVVITSESLIKDNPDVIRRFIAAVSRGYEYAAENPGEAADILLKHAPELSPELVKASQKWLSPRYAEGAPQWGFQRDTVWKGFGDWMYQHSLIAEEFKHNDAYTNDFLPERKSE